MAVELTQLEKGNQMFGLYTYPEAKAFMELQQDMTWTAMEIPVERDKHELLTVLSVPQRRLTDTTLELFVEIEQTVGTVWERIAEWFPHSEIEGACIEIARMEKAVHAFFYQKMSDVMNRSPEDTLNRQQDVKELKSKLVLLKRITTKLDDDKPLSLATVALIEQVLLFSNFAMLKSFKSNGHNMIKNTLFGVDYVIRDEQTHGEFAAYLHNTYVKELKDLGRINVNRHKDNIIQVAEEIIRHEDAVIDYVYNEVTEINNVTADQLKSFIRTRANQVLIDFGYTEHFTVHDNSIQKWFYQGINSIKTHDFFAAGTTQYSRNWVKEKFRRVL